MLYSLVKVDERRTKPTNANEHAMPKRCHHLGVRKGPGSRTCRTHFPVPAEALGLEATGRRCASRSPLAESKGVSPLEQPQ